MGHLDDYFLALTFLVTLAWQCLGFFLAYTLQVDKFTDLWGGSNFFILGESTGQLRKGGRAQLQLLPYPPPFLRLRADPGYFFSILPFLFASALLTLTLGGTYSARNIVASVFVMIWSVR